MPARLTIDGRGIEVEDGTTVLEAAQRLGLRIPTLCQVDGLRPSTSCSLCLVRVEGRPGYVPACGLPAATGMAVITEADDIRAMRRMALELLLSDHTGECQAPCKTACPAHLDIPGFTARLAVGDHTGAAAIVRDALVLPASLGRICPRLCEGRCRRGDLEAPLSIRNLHRFAADSGVNGAAPALPTKLPATGKRVAIVGAGPAGLAAAFHLLQRGHQATIFDAHDQPGGMLRYGIPEFRLPRAVLDREINVLTELGCEFRPGRKLGRDFTLGELRRGFDAVFLAVGAQASRGLGCPGEELALPALEFLEQVAEGKPPRVGPEVVIVGGGNTAMDASRSAVRLGADSVRVLYRRTRAEMPCLPEEVHAAEAEGITLDYLVAPVRLERATDGLRLTCVRMELGPPDESGRPRPIPQPGSEFTVRATRVIAAIGQAVEAPAALVGEAATSRRGIAADPRTLATALDGVFAGGDGVTGPDLAVRAVAAGKLAAASIDQFLHGAPVVGLPTGLNVTMEKLDTIELAELFRGIPETARTVMPELEALPRRHSFAEVELGFEAAAARAEAARCLGCGCGRATACQLRAYATEYGADASGYAGVHRRFHRDTSHPEVVFEAGKCILCGACVQVAGRPGADLGMTIVGRGFGARVAAPFSEPISIALHESALRAAEVCPTGALVRKRRPDSGLGNAGGSGYQPRRA